MEKQTIIDRFAEHQIELHPAGIWEFDAEGKKKPVIAFRQDGLDISSYPKDNMFKLRVDSTPYMVIDVDGGDILALYKQMPSLQRTLTTTTTREDKFHIYIQKPEDFPVTRIVNALPQIDILSNGIVFEGHLYNINKHYDIENTEIVTLREEEIKYLSTLIPHGITSYNNTSITNKRFNPAEKQLIEEYLNDTLKDERNLWKALTPKAEQKQGKSNYTVPDLAYDTFNRMAFFIALNEYIPHAIVIKFLEKFLVKEYNLNLNSTQTQQRLYKQIIPTLPVYEVDDYNDSFSDHIAKAPLSRDGQFKLVSTIDSQGGQKFVLLDKYTLEPQVMNGALLRSQKSIQFLYPAVDANTYTYGIPMIELTRNPFLPQTSYDFKRRIFTLSELTPSEYITNATERVEKPNNIIAKAIHSIFKVPPQEYSDVDPEDFYYHWLANVVFGTKQLSTILCLAADATVGGGTGKSTLTMRLPIQMLPYGAAAKIDQGTGSWGDAFYDSKLTCFDDLETGDKEWDKLYNTMKKETTGGPTKKNLKGKGIVLTKYSPNMSISANFLPKIDESDRRLFIWTPTEKLSDAEGQQLSEITEDFHGYHEEIQEIANYCFYLYNNHKDKYHRELFMHAPVTSFYKQAKTEGATSKKLFSIILNGPDSLFDSFVPNVKSKMSKREIVEFILGQIAEPNRRSNNKHSLHLPQDFCKVVLEATRDEPMPNMSPKNMGFALGCTFSPLSISHTKYRDNKKYAEWVTRGVRLTIEADTIAKYKAWLKYSTPEAKPLLEVVDV